VFQTYRYYVGGKASGIQGYWSNLFFSINKTKWDVLRGKSIVTLFSGGGGGGGGIIIWNLSYDLHAQIGGKYMTTKGEGGDIAMPNT
jgi:hypothetical protein